MTDVGDSERKVAQGTEAANGESTMIPQSVPAFKPSHDPSAAVPSAPLRAGGRTKGEGGRCRASRHTPSGPPRIGGKPGATQNEADPFRPGRNVPSATVGPPASSRMHKTQMTAEEKERRGCASHGGGAGLRRDEEHSQDWLCHRAEMRWYKGKAQRNHRSEASPLRRKREKMGHPLCRKEYANRLI
jgi:hypothetical protein